MGSINDLLDAPYYTGAPVTTLVPSNYPIAIAGHPYMMDVRKYTRQTLAALAPQQDNSKSVTDAALSREGYQHEGQSRFGLGAGQAYFDDAETASDRRFFSSKGIDNWSGLDRSLTLLHDTEKKGGTNAPGTSTNLKVLAVGGYLYIADGTNLKFTADPSPTNPSWTPIAAGGTIASIATDGVNVYVAIAGAALQRSVIGSGTMAAFGTLQPTFIAYANGRLIGAISNTLFEIDGAGAKAGGVDLKVDARGSSAIWSAATQSPHAIFVALTVGGTSEIYSLSVDSTTSLLDPPVWAGALPNGETLKAMTFYGGVVLLATSIGIRVAQLISTFSVTTSSKSLDYGEAVLIPGGVSCLEPQSKFCWFGWTNFDGTSTGLGRADLSVTTSPDTAVPAYASDLMATAQGAVLGVASFNGRRYFAISGVGLFGETTTYVQSGTYNTGWIRFGSLVDKAFTSMKFGTDPLVGSIAASLNFVDGSSRSMGAIATSGLTESSLLDGSGHSVAAQVVLTLTRGSPSTAPVLRWWMLNALPKPPRVEEIVVPLLLNAKVVDFIGNEVTIDPRAEFDYLSSLRSSAIEVIYQEGNSAQVVHVDNLAIQPADAGQWMEPRGRGGQPPDHFWFSGPVVSVRLLTRES